MREEGDVLLHFNSEHAEVRKYLRRNEAIEINTISRVTLYPSKVQHDQQYWMVAGEPTTS